MSKIVSILNVFPSKSFLNHYFPNLHTIGAVTRKLWSLTNFLKESSVTYKRRNGSLKGTKFLYNIFSNTEVMALVIANGPSANHINWSSVGQLQKQGKIKVFVLNSYDGIVPDFICPDFVVLSDPGHFPNNANGDSLWKRIIRDKNSRLVTPCNWHDSRIFKSCKDSICLHFDDRSLELLSDNISPLRPRGYPTITTYKTISYAIFLGFSEIYVAGLDNSNFLNFSLNDDNEVIQFSHHAKDQYAKTNNLTKNYGIKVEDYFYDIAYQNKKVRDCFGNYPIFNLSNISFLDVFPKAAKYRNHMAIKLLI